MSEPKSFGAWIGGLLAGVLGYVLGRLDALKASREAQAKAEKTVEVTRAEAEALDHDELKHEVDRWTKH